MEHGEQIIITKHGHPVAQLVPANQAVDREKRAAAIKALRSFAQAHDLKLAGLDWKELRDEGRK